eukprot:2147478-Amphidinium_carterae.1
MVEGYDLGTPDNALESLLPWVLQHTCFAINRYLVHTDVVLADIKPITVNKLDIRNKEKTEGIWFGTTTNSGEHIIATMDESGIAIYTRSLTRLTPELQWGKEVFDKITTPQMDSMNEDYVEEEHI